MPSDQFPPDISSPADSTPPPPASVSEEEIARFGSIAAQWWDPKGPMRPLHAMNPLRIGWISHFLPLRAKKQPPLRLLDIGCGAGLASEALATEGHDVTGLDASGQGISAARAHLEACPLPPGAGPLTYRTGSAEELVSKGAAFDAVVALEVIEHVTDPAAFMDLLARLTLPGGQVFISTMNRTPRAWLFAILGAEYIARLLPTGTHDWNKFLTPAELAAAGRSAGLRMTDISGMVPGIGGWKKSRNLNVNYITRFTKS
ncbi:bifunctional 2-polyprenyl-6-hydroxyphenol methylase/3-demethylubiquinol 3-O-methyltransferase UbiG [Acetobacter sp. AN02]|uniref:bifunctional 2-polyprenyl-6-hydroxyphenol methylase/3-demethylubiquinol 3-O-methyltransferase UbiG n=1 Tax=Acetobacter sp. AN02 TaxID=2894186 RepID=UPI0024345C3E|nr:bifunctional 2-polyprenyl-6-hydroxyphenol methylase/3-demethylubiquinol 3-O-methyltransferase UbiG [Acetobacter sp. AN02]MDG6093514.1 bifunctional 2-polyprenyl-6-hydroxyphenol methylase/3-demethylubiquinol 3-O-methyltransferase UbiG [Acetobacter sp. AN02]